MSKLPLTDEEKQQLDHLLHDSEDESKSDKKEAKAENAFTMSENDVNRLGQIDSELQNFPETSDLKGEQEEGENFWRSLVLEQALKEIDVKLAALHEVEDDDQQTED